MSEREFATKVKEALSDCHVLRIEMAVERGVPDMNVCYQGKEIWLELKLKVQERILLRPPQFAWATRRTHSSGRCYVLALDPLSNNVEIHKYPLVVKPLAKYVTIASLPEMELSLKSLPQTLLPSLFT